MKPFKKTLDDYIVDAIESALIDNNGNKTHAAAQLKISIRTLRKWVADYKRLDRFKRDTSHVDRRYTRCPL